MFGKMHNMAMLAKFLVYYCLIVFNRPKIKMRCLLILKKKSFNAAPFPFLFIPFL